MKMKDVKEIAGGGAKEVFPHLSRTPGMFNRLTELCTRFLSAYIEQQEPVGWISQWYVDHQPNAVWPSTRKKVGYDQFPIFTAPPEPTPQHVCGECHGDPELCDIHDCGDAHKPAVGAAPLPEEVKLPDWPMAKQFKDLKDVIIKLQMAKQEEQGLVAACWIAADMLERMVPPIPDDMILMPREPTQEILEVWKPWGGPQERDYVIERRRELYKAQIAIGEKK